MLEMKGEKEENGTVPTAPPPRSGPMDLIKAFGRSFCGDEEANRANKIHEEVRIRKEWRKWKGWNLRSISRN